MISLNYRGSLHFIDNEPYESIDDTYSRGWYIMKNQNMNEKYENLYPR